MSSKNRIYLSPPHMGRSEQKYIKKAFDSNWISSVGPNIDAFEKSLEDHLGIKHTAALSSGTASIHLALILLGIGPGDYVIVQGFTFSATINPIIYLGATPVLVDSEVDTWNMDPGLLEKAIIDCMSGEVGKMTEAGRLKIDEKQRLKGSEIGNLEFYKGKKPKAIIPVHLYGMPANMGKIMAIANKYEIPVVEDSAEALGSKYKDKPVGTFGEMGILSFNGNKIITTSGGGALISDNTEYIRKAKFLATQARDKAAHYQHSQIGYNYRMSNIIAGVGRGQIEVLEERLNQRRENFRYYKQNLSGIEGVSFVEEPSKDYFSNRWLTTILIDPQKTGTNKDEVRVALEDEDIECRPLWKPMHRQPVFSSYPSYVTGVSEKLFDQGLCLPSGSNMTDEDKERVMQGLLKVFKKKR
jgi:dTDP-4-amino-4,6-dideoxygalactose transaminase